MNPSAWTAAIVIVVLGIALIVSTFLARSRAARADGFARSVGLDLPASLRAAVTERVALRHRGGAIGMIVGIATSVFVLSIYPSSDQSFAAPFVLVGGAFAGLAIGVAITSARAAAPLDPTAVKYARTSAVSLSDYVAPLERTGARIVVGLAVAVAIASVIVGVPLGGILVTLTALAAGALAFFEVAGRRIVDRSQPAGSPAELAWDDAVRASVLRDIVTAPITLGAYAVVVSAAALVERLLQGNDFANGAIVLAAVIAAVTLATVAITSRPQRYFLRRLWPEVKAA